MGRGGHQIMVFTIWQQSFGNEQYRGDDPMGDGYPSHA